MKRISLLLILLAAMLLLPTTVFAEGEEVTTTGEEVTETAEESKEAIVYLFRGEGCPHCAEAEAWFQSIEEEYGSMFKIVDYETWENTENRELFVKVLKARGEYVSDEESLGVPYILVGDKSWNGFADDYKDEIIEQIKNVFAQNIDDRYDIMKYLDTASKGKKAPKKESNDVLALILILLVCGGIGFGVHKARTTVK